MEVCPYLEETFKILGRSWNGLIINYLSRCNDCSAQWELVEKQIISTSPVQIIYVLTEKGKALAEALHPIEAWAQSYVDLTDQRTAK